MRCADEREGMVVLLLADVCLVSYVAFSEMLSINGFCKSLAPPLLEGSLFVGSNSLVVLIASGEIRVSLVDLSA